jgi:hypothetical protein
MHPANVTADMVTDIAIFRNTFFTSSVTVWECFYTWGGKMHPANVTADMVSTN